MIWEFIFLLLPGESNVFAGSFVSCIIVVEFLGISMLFKIPPNFTPNGYDALWV